MSLQLQFYGIVKGSDTPADIVNREEQISVYGVRFDLITDSDGKVRVSRNGRHFNGHLEHVGKSFRVSFIREKPFNNKADSVKHLVYWYIFDDYKKSISVDNVEWPYGTVSRIITSVTDDALQLTIWQIEIKIEEARDLIAKLPTGNEDLLGKNRVYKAEIGLKVHRAIELMLKILLGMSLKEGWKFFKENNIHWLSVLYDKLEAQDSDITTKLDAVFQRTVMVHGDPEFGNFRNPTSLEIDGVTLTITSENTTNPGSKHLRDHLVLMDMHYTYGQSYLGDAVRKISEAYLKYVADAEPYLVFIETAMREVVNPAVKHLLPSGRTQ